MTYSFSLHDEATSGWLGSLACIGGSLGAGRGLDEGQASGHRQPHGGAYDEPDETVNRPGFSGELTV